MKVVVLGASGGCGQWVVKLAQQRGHEVTAIGRPNSTYTPPDGVALLKEDIQLEGVFERILKGQDAAISCLGMTLTKGNPFRPLRSPPDLMSTVAKRLTEAMPVRGVRRVLSISSGAVGDSADRTHWLIRLFFNKSNVSVSHNDLLKMEQIYEAAGLDWMAIRPVTLKEGGPTNTGKPTAFYGLRSRITKGEVARLLVEAAERSEPFTDHTPLVAG